MGTVRLTARLGAGLILLAMAGTAQAGGFARGQADTDILFETGNFNMRAGVTYVSPRREFTKNPVAGLVGTSYTSDYAIPSFAARFNLSDDFRCAGTMVDNAGAAVRYAVPKPSGKLLEEFTTNEKALTCGVRFQAGQGEFWLLGGGFMEEFDYHRVNLYPVGSGVLDLKGREYGYRIGAAYAIPDIALRAQVMYRSGTSYGADGMLTLPAALLNPLAPPGLDVPLVAAGSGNLPQTVEVKLQSGIVPGWVGFGSVKWSDWSVQKELLVTTAIPGVGSEDVYNWKDGWTVSGGVGHAFSDRVSGLVSLTWDSSVSTGYDLSSDTYTFAVGGLLRDTFGGELRGGAGVSYLTSAEVTKGADAGQAVKAGYAVGLNLGYNIKW